MHDVDSPRSQAERNRPCPVSVRSRSGRARCPGRGADLLDFSPVDVTLLVALVIALALIFDFTNGFHDTANAMATTIATGALKPRVAVSIAAVLNFGGAFISITVAATVAKGIVNAEVVTTTMIFAGLIGAIVWNLVTWWFGVPSSSSHALIGGMIGAVVAGVGFSGVEGTGVLSSVIVPALIAPVLAGIVALGATVIVYRMIRTYARER